MEVRYTPAPEAFCRMTTQEVREKFLIETLFSPDAITMVYCDVDRAIPGSAVPVKGPLTLGSAPQLRAEYFCQRREMGVLNIGQGGTVTVDGKTFAMAAPGLPVYRPRVEKRSSLPAMTRKRRRGIICLATRRTRRIRRRLSRKSRPPVQLGSDAEANSGRSTSIFIPTGPRAVSW
jgi:5-keto 4-deoxyuronate isomerase